MQGRLEREMKAQRTVQCALESMPYFITEWYMNMQSSKKSNTSCYEYIKISRRFLEYMDSDIKNIDASNITLQLCESFMISCQTRIGNDGMEIPTTDRYKYGVWSALNSLMIFLSERNYIEYNFMTDIKRPHVSEQKESRKSYVLTKNDFNKILAAAKNGSGYKQGLLENRDVLIILLFMTTGIKKTTLSEINIEDINFSEKKLRVVENKNKVIIYDLNEQLISYINKWLVDREQFNPLPTENALFLKKDGTRLGDDSIYNIVKKCCYKGIGKKLSPQNLREGFCMILYKKTHDIEFVSEAIGNSSLQSTRRYIKRGKIKKDNATDIMSGLLNI